MQKSIPLKRKYDKIGRSFSLVFNRTTMYTIDHPFTVESIGDFYETIVKGLNAHSPIVIIMNRDNFFIEDEPFDARLNTSKMAAHFKKTDIESVSFEKGVKKADIKKFFSVFTNSKKHSTAGAMRFALSGLGIKNIKINYVFYKKMTTDEEVITKDSLNEASGNLIKNQRKKLSNDVLKMITESVILEEFEKSISLKKLMADPAEVSKGLVQKDLSNAAANDGEIQRPGLIIADQLTKLKEEIKKSDRSEADIKLPDLADAVFDMKQNLLKELNAQKALGVIYENEMQILDEADDITDQVILELVKEEYKKGKISAKRLGQILRRLIPEQKDLQRLLPKLKNLVMAEGMSPSDFMLLVEEIGKELQSDELSELFKTSAEEIGLDRDKLINEFKVDPSGAAELIYLASEIRKGTGDEKVLTEVLVDYIERVGSNMASEISDIENNENRGHLRGVISGVGSKILDKLKLKDINPDVLVAIEDRLNERIEKFLTKLETASGSLQDTLSSTEDNGQTSIFRILEDSADQGEQLQKILAHVRSSIEEGKVDENNFQQLYDEILKAQGDQKKEGKEKFLPNGVLNYINTLSLIDKEISRSLRYDTAFSVVTFSIINLTPQKPVPSGLISGNEISQAVMGELVNVLRDADLVGILNKKLIIVLLPMTEEENAKLAIQRILKKLHSEPFTIKDIPIKAHFAGAVTSFDHEYTPDLHAFLAAAENNHNEFVNRIKYIQELK